MIEIKDLSFSYGQKPVLENISFNLEKGKIYGLLGENGVGKTTLLTLICGLKKPVSGSIHTDGQVPFNRTPSLLGSQYYLPDEVAAEHMTASYYAESWGKFWPRFDMDKFLIIMREFENDPSAMMDKMSMGQLKKTYISFALACNCEYLLMDEPTNGLDIPSKSQFRKALMKYTGEDSTIMISTHQVRDLEDIIDPVIILDSREVLLNASMEEIASKLFFDYGSKMLPEALFCEMTPAGCVQVLKNPDGAESKVNVEALFNAVYGNKETIKEIFSDR